MTTVAKNYQLHDIDHAIPPTDDPVSWHCRIHANAPFNAQVRTGPKRVDVIDEVSAEAGFENGVVLRVPRGAYISIERQEALSYESTAWIARLVAPNAI